jgi:hypothetical protein
MAPAPPRPASSERSVHSSLRTPSATTYSFAQQLPGPLTGLSRTTTPAPPGAFRQVAQKPVVASPAGRWAAGLPKAATAAEVVASSAADSTSNDDDDIALSVDAELDFYSRLVPTASAVPRNPKRPLGGGGLRGTGSIVSGPASAASRIAPPSGTAMLHPQVLAVSTSSPASSLTSRSISPPSTRMQRLSSDSSSAQLSRRAVAGHKHRPPASPEVSQGDIVAFQLAKEEFVSQSESPPEAPTAGQSSHQLLTSPMDPPHQHTAQQAPDQLPTHQHALEPVPLRRDQIEILRSRSLSAPLSPASVPSAGSLPSFSPPKTTSSTAGRSLQSTIADVTMSRKSTSTATKSPFRRSPNSRADAMRDAILGKSTPAHPAKSVQFTRSAMGSSLPPLRSGSGSNGVRVLNGTLTPKEAVHSDVICPGSKDVDVPPTSDVRSKRTPCASVEAHELERSECVSSSPKSELGVIGFQSETSSPPVWSQQNGSRSLVTGSVHDYFSETQSFGATASSVGSTSSPAIVTRVPSPPLVDDIRDTVHNSYVQDLSVLPQEEYCSRTGPGDLFARNLMVSDTAEDGSSLSIDNLSLSDIMVGLYPGKESLGYRSGPADFEPAEDGLLPPLPNSEREGVRFESMLRSMGWQPLDDEDATLITNLR